MVSSNTSHVCRSYSVYLMSNNTQYRKVVKHSENRTLLVSIPLDMAEALQIQKGDTVKMTLEKDSIRLERA